MAAIGAMRILLGSALDNGLVLLGQYAEVFIPRVVALHEGVIETFFVDIVDPVGHGEFDTLTYCLDADLVCQIVTVFVEVIQVGKQVVEAAIDFPRPCRGNRRECLPDQVGIKLALRSVEGVAVEFDLLNTCIHCVSPFQVRGEK
ncbi:hypothetical protein D3C72_1296460 [compost metagenome]